jgi:EAL domain-containing protein (putative c-di-GMP-specific phosphodiesterase class I)/AmiR/NasT family two-component response regulator
MGREVTSAPPIRVLIADDDASVRKVLEDLVQADPGLSLIGSAEDADGAVALACRHRPDVAILDVKMHGGGPDAARRILAGSPATWIIALSAYEDDASVRQMIAAGARSYVVKGVGASELIAAIYRSFDGAATLSDRVAGHLVSELAMRLSLEEPEREHHREVGMRIRKILEDPERLAIAYQPIVDLTDGRRTIGLEALSRFPDGGGDPSCWFRDAELIGLGVELEETAIRRALEPLERIPHDVYVAVNASPTTLMASEFPELFADVDPGRLVVEVTEHAPIDDYAMLRERLDELAAAGIRLAVDDAGAGYASLRHILKLRPDVIKLDISLTRNIDEEPLQRALAAALVTFANELGASIVAEGVERSEEVVVLTDLGVRYAQGYHFAKPNLDLDELFAPDHPAVSGCVGPLTHSTLQRLTAQR